MPRQKKEETKKQEGSPRRISESGESAQKPAAEKKQEQYIFAVGRRKEATAVVRLYPVKGAILVNGKALAEYFVQPKLQEVVQAPFAELKIDPFRVEAMVRGGGIRGQAEALRLGISRALVALQPDTRPRLRALGFLTRDARVKERRKYGLKKARRAPQWQKR